MTNAVASEQMKENPRLDELNDLAKRIVISLNPYDRTEWFLDNLPKTKSVSEYSVEEARHIENEGVVAWKESDQGWEGLLCKNGKSYYRCTEPNDNIKLPYDRRKEISNNTLPGWQCIYCGLGHRVMIREECYPPFQILTDGIGKKTLWNLAFEILNYILITQQSTE